MTDDTAPDRPDRLLALEQRLAELTEQVAQLRALTTRAYEQTPARASRLLALRAAPAWQEAYAPGALVSARIGAFRGGEPLFDRALRSVRRQTYPHWEAIVVCDGPDPATVERIAALGDARIRCVERPRTGPYPDRQDARWLVAGTHPFNEAVGLARGAWIAPLDQDDEWSEDHLEVLLAQACATQAELVYGAVRVAIGGVEETYFGAWPPQVGEFGFQGAIYHAGLSDFLYDVNAHLVPEPGDWNLARRMLEAGVRCDAVEHAVATYHLDADAPSVAWWRARAAERGLYRGVAR